MSQIKRSLIAAALAAIGMITIVATSSPSDAATCRSRMDGQGTGQGVGGVGTEVAKSRAAADWSAKVQAKHGSAFATFGKAQGVRYDCRKGAVLEAKCVVAAKPCK